LAEVSVVLSNCCQFCTYYMDMSNLRVNDTMLHNLL
jgi:hypothetical protein